MADLGGEDAVANGELGELWRKVNGLAETCAECRGHAFGMRISALEEAVEAEAKARGALERTVDKQGTKLGIIVGIVLVVGGSIMSVVQALIISRLQKGG